jgi:fatty-acyl-CoA synthase
VRDRAKDIVISGGENISSVEVEKTLADHPAVAEVAIVAAPDEKWGEIPKAYVALKPGASATAEELIAFCRSRLAHFKAPKLVEFGPLPRTATGKVRKNELRKRARSLGVTE